MSAIDWQGQMELNTGKAFINTRGVNSAKFGYEAKNTLSTPSNDIVSYRSECSCRVLTLGSCDLYDVCIYCIPILVFRPKPQQLREVQP